MAAPEVPLRGATAQVKLRNPVNTALLSLIPFWNTNGHILHAQALANVPGGEQINQAVSFILLIVFAPIGIWWMQNELNKVWALETEGGAALLHQGAAPPAASRPVEGEAQPPAPQQQEAPPAPPAS